MFKYWHRFPPQLLFLWLGIMCPFLVKFVTICDIFQLPHFWIWWWWLYLQLSVSLLWFKFGKHILILQIIQIPLKNIPLENIPLENNPLKNMSKEIASIPDIESHTNHTWKNKILKYKQIASDGNVWLWYCSWVATIQQKCNQTNAREMVTNIWTLELQLSFHI